MMKNEGKKTHQESGSHRVMKDDESRKNREDGDGRQ
jgi:hypothetical protein